MPPREVTINELGPKLALQARTVTTRGSRMLSPHSKDIQGSTIRGGTLTPLDISGWI